MSVKCPDAGGARPASMQCLIRFVSLFNFHQKRSRQGRNDILCGPSGPSREDANTIKYIINYPDANLSAGPSGPILSIHVQIGFASLTIVLRPLFHYNDYWV